VSRQKYKYLYLPEQIQIAMNGLNHIHYLYDATGTKLVKHTTEDGEPTHTTDYVGSFVYEDGQLQYILMNFNQLKTNAGSVTDICGNFLL
jgi:hypothetical protein